MDKQKIINALRNLAPSVQPPPHLPHPDVEYDRHRHLINSEIGGPTEIVDSLMTVLHDDPALEILNAVTVQTPNAATHNQDWFRHIAQWLLDQSRSRNPEEVLDQLETFVSTNSVPMREVVALWGIYPSHPIEVQEGVQLVPLTSLPRTRRRDEFLGRHTGDIPLNMLLTQPKAAGALVHEFEYGPVLVVDEQPTSAEREDAEANILREHMLEIARCLVLVEKSPVDPVLVWYQTDETTPLVGGPLGAQGWGFRWAHTFQTPRKPQVLDETSVRALINGYFALDETTRAQLGVVLTRLNSSMMGDNEDEDKAIDLGIAMEALLGKGLSTDVPISYSLRLRGTLLLGGTSETRKENYYRLKELYDLRSRAAHGNKLGPRTSVKLGPDRNKEPVNTREFLDQGTRVCADMVRKIIERGGMPDWEALTLGW